MTDVQPLCAKPFCRHPAYNHETSDLTLGKCRYWRCRCRQWRAETMREVLDRLGVGTRELPPDDEVYSSGPVVFVPHPPKP